MKLYFSPLACSLAAHIVSLEAELDVTLCRTDLETKQTIGGGDLRALNPMGQVPTLVLDDGRVVAENSAVLLYLADRKPALGLAPAEGAFERYELLRWLSFVGTELHKRTLYPVFNGDAPETVKDHVRSRAGIPLAMLETRLGARPNLVGDTFTAADAYLFWALTVLPFGGVGLDAYPELAAYRKRHGERPAVRQALRFERREFETPFQP